MNQSLADVLAKVDDFFCKPASAVPLATLRIGISLTLLAQAWMVRSEVLEFFSSTGYVQGALLQDSQQPGIPTVATFTDFLQRFGISEDFGIYLVCAIYVVSLASLALGFCTRSSSVMAWFFHWTLMNTNRYRLFGKKTACRVPNSRERRRFLP